MSDIYSTELPPHIEKPLLQLVGIAEKYKLLTLQFVRPTFDRGYAIFIPGGTETVEYQEEDFLLGLKALGFLQLSEAEDSMGRSSGGHIFLTEKAYDWSHHEF